MAHVEASAVEVRVLVAEKVAHALQSGVGDVAGEKALWVWVVAKDVLQLAVETAGEADWL